MCTSPETQNDNRTCLFYQISDVVFVIVQTTWTKPHVSLQHLPALLQCHGPVAKPASQMLAALGVAKAVRQRGSKGVTRQDECGRLHTPGWP